jgi:hypothetical protein
MKKFTILFFGLFFFCTCINSNTVYSFSIVKPINSNLSSYAKGSEFIKLSFRQFATLTGKKANLWNRLSFNLLKAKVKHDLRKNPNLLITEYSSVGKGMRTAGWILYGALLLLLLLLIIMGIALKK